MTPVALHLKEAAAAVGVSERTLRRALHQTEIGVYPPPIAGKRDSKGRITIAVRELERWHDSLDDA
jgi:hypothetical protein